VRTNARVYIMKSDDGRLKIGHSVDPSRRSKQLGVAVSIMHETDVLDQAERIERLAHRVLALSGKHLCGEWFDATVEDAISAIDIAVRQAESVELPLGGRLNFPSRGGITPTLTLRLPQEIRDKLEQMAERDRRKLTQYVQKVLADHVARESHSKKR